MLVIETFVSNLVCWDISSTRNMFSLYKETFEYGEYGLHNIRHALDPSHCSSAYKEPSATSFDSSTFHMNMHPSNAAGITLLIEIF